MRPVAVATLARAVSGRCGRGQEAVDIDDLEFSVLAPELGVVLADGDVVEDDVVVGAGRRM
ncbi:hypothetical protein AN480_29390 [Mycobacterium intracellulare subsp. chimaera]|nr:hypothetical protein AN480_29390 [Mycobacterium intracellulare subsp. chimaera]